MNPENLTISNYTYELPDDRIAKYPLPIRDHSKCLILNTNGEIEENIYANIGNYIPNGSLMIFNNTKVVEARLLFQKETGSTIEIFCLEPDERYSDITTAMLEKKEVYWKCLVGGAKKWKNDMLSLKVSNNGEDLIIYAEKIEKRSDYFLIHFTWDATELSFAEILHFAGIIPLPPYLNRETETSDKERYQTVYAEHDGSVAAPTAGLHFTPELLQKLKAKDIKEDFVTLHVGAGTFKPVKSELMKDHEMHFEAIDVTISLLEDIQQHLSKNIIAVGTTSLRTLESLYWIGVKIATSKDAITTAPKLYQWDPYNLPQNITTEVALQALSAWMRQHQLQRLLTKTQIIIAPGYDLKVVNAIVTNFHQPRSTLILLIAAIIGDKWREVYNYALAHDFRFLSYGDGSLLWKQKRV